MYRQRSHTAKPRSRPNFTRHLHHASATKARFTNRFLNAWRQVDVIFRSPTPFSITSTQNLGLNNPRKTMFQTAKTMCLSSCLLKIESIKFISLQLIDDVLRHGRQSNGAHEALGIASYSWNIAHRQHGLAEIIRTLWETVQIFKFQVRRKIFVPLLIQIGGLMITNTMRKKSIFKSIMSTRNRPFDLMRWKIDLHVCESSLNTSMIFLEPWALEPSYSCLRIRIE